jgi:hypothetical protein
MTSLLAALAKIDHSITRNFEFDYILFDALFLLIYIVLLVQRKKTVPLKAGLAFGVVMYVIDGIIWNATGVREYRLSAPWVKHPTDFMMDVSYGIVAFSWIWIAFERKSSQDVALWTLVLFTGWLLVPTFSFSIHLNDDPITTIRHMHSQVWLQILAVIAGYVLLIALRYDWKTILYVFGIGCLLSFMMEFSLFISGIRPPSIPVLLYDTLILMNQGVPYVLVIWDRILPLLAKKRGTHESAPAGE